jgi:putative PEP-CTERM system histidine kinase
VTLAIFSHAIAAIAYGVFAVSLLRAREATARGATTQTAFIAAVLISLAWSIAGIAAQRAMTPGLLLATGLIDLCRYAAWFLFAVLLLQAGAARHRKRVQLLVGAAILALLANGLPLLIRALGVVPAEVLVRNAPLASLALPVLGLVLLEQIYRSADEESRWHAAPLCIALGCLFVFDAYLHSHVLLFGSFDADSLAIRAAVHALPVVPLLYIATKRHADWKGPLRLSRDAAFHTATLVLAGAYLLVISGISYYLHNVSDDWGRALALALLVIAGAFLAALLLSATLRARLRVFIGKNFFRYRYDYRTEWLRLTSRLTVTGSPAGVGELVIQGLAELVHCRAGALWYRDADGRRLVQVARWNVSASGESVPLDSPFARFMVERDWVYDLDAFRAPTRDINQGAEPPAWLLSEPRHWIAVPLIVGEALHGFVVIGRPHVTPAVNWEVRDLLKTASRQAASFLALMHATDALLEVRKFDAFNRMSAFVVHDLKNIVAQLSLMMQNARRLKDNPEFQEDMLTTVENSLERMRRLMLQLRSGETPAGVAVGVSLSAVAQRICASVAARGRTVDLSVREEVLTRGHEERVERVLGHLVDNALDATSPAGGVAVAVSRQASQAKIVVSDTGQGMSAEFISNGLFKPFTTTKDGGMGIGAYESRRYIQEIGGSLSVDSEVGRGTVITVMLPLLDANQAATRNQQAAS